jgi:uncharacterized protein (TIGR00162 family)
VKTTIREKTKARLTNPILICGLPGSGMVGKIAIRYLVKQLKAKKLAEMYSPHFPYYVLVDKNGDARLPRGDFYFWKNDKGENDLMFLTGDSQAQTVEGQYNIASAILDLATKHGVKTVITIGGYRKEADEKPKVVAASTDKKLLNKALQAKALASSEGNPIVGAAGLLLGLAKFRNMAALCLLGETRGYLPDPKAAKSVLEVLQSILKNEVDLDGIEEDIEQSERMVEKIRDIEKRREIYEQRMRIKEQEKVTYIA